MKYFRITLLLVLTLSLLLGAAACGNKTSGAPLKVGDTVRMANLEWIVVEIKEDVATLTTLKPVTSMAYTKTETASWDSSEVRIYLNGEFLNTFSDAEKAKLLPTELVNTSPVFGFGEGAVTTDTVFLRSYAEEHNHPAPAPGETCWLRTTGETLKNVATVRADGTANAQGARIDLTEAAVRPTVRMKANTDVAKTAVYEFSKRSSAGVGDIVLMGKLGGADIRFRVIDKKNDSLVLLSEEVLFSSKYQNAYANVKFEGSAVEKALSDFKASAFDSAEQKAIKVCTLPSVEDIKKVENKKAFATASALKAGVYRDANTLTSPYWLLDGAAASAVDYTDTTAKYASYVSYSGLVSLEGAPVDSTYLGVRPLLEVH